MPVTFRCELESIALKVKWVCHRTGVKNELFYTKKAVTFL